MSGDASADRDAVTVSVALATRNGARFVVAQVRSILGQTRPVDEIVVSDDASTDDTIALIQDEIRMAAGRRPVLTVLVNPEPLGVAANFSRAITACRGGVVLLSDQDDVWYPDHAALTVEALGTGPLAVGTDADLVGADGKPTGSSLFAAHEVSRDELARVADGRSLDVLLHRNLFTGATMGFRRELFALAEPVPFGWLHDEWLALVAATVGEVALLRRSTIAYRQHGANEVGAAVPTLGYKVRRVLESRGERTALLALRWASFAERASALPGAGGYAVLLADQKAAFERFRAGLPASRIRRLLPVWRRRAGYARFASRGRTDIVRDLLAAA